MSSGELSGYLFQEGSDSEEWSSSFKGSWNYMNMWMNGWVAETAEVSFKQKQEKYVGHIAKSEGGERSFSSILCSSMQFEDVYKSE